MSQETVWFDFENAPHVWVLSPIIERLKAKDYKFLLTARDFSCTVELSRRLGYNVWVVGRTGMGRNKITKAARIVERAAALFALMLGRRDNTALAFSHGSRSQLLAAFALRIPAILMDDYEYSDQTLLRLSSGILVPFPIPKEAWGRHASKVVHYPGLKEDLYLSDFVPSDLPHEIVENRNRVLVMFRPESCFAHYQSQRSKVLQQSVLEYLARTRDKIFLVLMPRDATQRRELLMFCKDRGVSYWMPDKVVDGPSLVAQMDVVIGGGGTMTREAVALGVPSYSFFSGKWGAVDNYLEKEGCLISIKSENDTEHILLRKRLAVEPPPHNQQNQALETVVSFLEKQLENAKV